MIRAAIVAVLGSVTPAVAEPFLLAQPIDCVLGESCFIQHHVDLDPGPGVQDYACQSLTYDTHQGVDFAVPTLADMTRGVEVRASAAGVVRGVRDEMPDVAYDGGDLLGRDCGNGVAITHPDGWETQYCHMRLGSIRVQPGQQVEAGAPLGLVGLSGLTQFPHVHLTLRRNGDVVDPFAPDGAGNCAPASTLWQVTPPYVPGALIDAGFAPAIPSFDAIQAGTATQTPPATDTALVGFGYAFGVRVGDVMRITIDGPQGQVITHDATLDRDQARVFRATGRKRQSAGWSPGRYTLTILLMRDGTAISTRTETIDLQ